MNQPAPQAIPELTPEQKKETLGKVLNICADLKDVLENANVAMVNDQPFMMAQKELMIASNKVDEVAMWAMQNLMCDEMRDIIADAMDICQTTK